MNHGEDDDRVPSVNVKDAKGKSSDENTTNWWISANTRERVGTG
ncbi:MAG TPA: hypothetical protein VFS76_00100 [Pyrinomonadaceae bacterium]|nr:hypothetical protein [Pyrinomonadaceae bacterium]